MFYVSSFLYNLVNRYVCDYIICTHCMCTYMYTLRYMYTLYVYIYVHTTVNVHIACVFESDDASRRLTVYTIIHNTDKTLYIH